MPDLHLLKGCELHVHIGGCLYVEDLLELGKDIYEEVDWSLFVDAYTLAFGKRPDPIALFREALSNDAAALTRLRNHFVVGAADSGDFERFHAKFNLAICLSRHWRRVLQREEEVIQRIIEHHRSEGLDYVEYRAMYMLGSADPEGFLHFHRLNAQTIQEASRNGFEARYIISLPRRAPLEGYALVQRLLAENPGLIPTIVGLDFCFFEEGYPPRTVQPLLARLQQDNQQHPERALDVVYHVGEVYFDKSLESAIRWCDEIAAMGISRLGHAIALGLDPTVAVARRPQAHETEPASERLDQISYDLHHAEALSHCGIAVDKTDLQREREDLQQLSLETTLQRPYTTERLAEVRRRQDFVLERLEGLGTVIESCPTSNLRIGAVPHPSSHPLHRFLDSRVNLAISADDPGIFDSPLAAEIDWVLEHTDMDAAALKQRLGDPRRFKLGSRPPLTETRET